MLGDAFYGSADLDAAMGYYQEAQKLGDQSEAAADCGVGKIKLAKGDVDGALELFKKSASEEEAAGYFNNAAVFAVKERKFDHSVKLCEDCT